MPQQEALGEFNQAVRSEWNTVMLVPTGIGATVGGFAGDASQTMRLLASVSERLITHPNVANAGVFQHMPDNVWYVEGYALDQWMRGQWVLGSRRRPHRLGVILDAGIPERMRTHTLNTIGAIETVYGIELVGIETTSEPVVSEVTLSASGGSQGNVSNPATLIEAGQTLKMKGATAIAVGVHFLDAETEALEKAEAAYKAGQGLDPIGGLEALISHTLVRALKMPCAHAPVLTEENSAPEFESLLDPRVASEYIAPTFLPCVLTGLRQAPDFYTAGEDLSNRPCPSSVLTVHDVDVVVVPADAMGSIPVLEAIEKGITVIGVKENTTHMQMTRAAFSVQQRARLYTVNNYIEAAGLIQSLRLGLPVPASVCADA